MYGRKASVRDLEYPFFFGNKKKGEERREGERMLENTGVFVCSVCGFVYVGDVPPEICPVCKVPSWKFDRVERRA